MKITYKKGKFNVVLTNVSDYRSYENKTLPETSNHKSVRNTYKQSRVISKPVRACLFVVQHF